MSEIDDRLIEIPYNALSSEALQGVIEEYCTRGGYDSNMPLADRVAKVRIRLQVGQARLLFDPQEGSINICETPNTKRGGNSPA